VDAEDGLDGGGIQGSLAGGEPLGDPAGLGPLLELAHVLLAAPALHRNDRDEAAAGDEADDEQPPLELRHAPEG